MIQKSDTCEVRTHAGEPTGLAGQRLNHSAKVSSLPFLGLKLLKNPSLITSRSDEKDK